MERVFTYPGIEELEILERKFDFWLRHKSKLLSSLTEGKRILEIGCGIGSLTQLLSQMNYQITAIDISDACLVKAMERGINATFLRADICDPSALRQYYGFFDSAIMSDVLEHVEKEDRALRGVFSLLRRSGVLVLTVPAFQILYSKLDRKISHLRRYSKKGIIKKLRSAKFCVEFCRYWNLPGLFGWVIVHKALKGEALYLSTLMREPYNKWLSLEKHLIFPLGLTLVVKARKP